ncbi:hypothetical protein [Pantoea ananatis]|uniref:hypothetical protein n=1 Tax=Pantoea ananas TaxID=553 RepID=UPI000CF43C22|nr:hypothetical protein [Pantoea ananatis]PQK71583.1 hypothetical protein CG427_17235 [Pantoea ananatis]
MNNNEVNFNKVFNFKKLPAWIVKKELPICQLGIGLNSNNMRAYPMKNKFSLTHYLNIYILNYKLNCILLHFRYFIFFHYKMILM